MLNLIVENQGLNRQISDVLSSHVIVQCVGSDTDESETDERDTDEREGNSECGEVVSSPCMICVSNIPPAFLAHFPSDILLLTIFVTGWLPRPCLM